MTEIVAKLGGKMKKASNWESARIINVFFDESWIKLRENILWASDLTVSNLR